MARIAESAKRIAEEHTRVPQCFSYLAAAALTGALLLGSPLHAVFADAGDPTVRSQSTEQMSSAPEVVHINAVTDPAIRRQSFNESWKFKLGDPSGAEVATFDDSSWSQVNLPHDFSIDQPYTRSGEAESAYKPGGVGWYRKTFEVSKALQGKRVFLDFDGVYMDSTVWVNGHELGNHPYGYSPFAFDITDEVVFGGQNTVAVRVNAQTPSSRWYSGAGIGRDVDLVVTDPVHVERDGVRVTTPNLANEAQGSVATKLATSIRNDGKEAATLRVVQTIFAKGADPAAPLASVTTERNVDAGATDTFEATATTTAAPALWDTEHPNLYIARTTIERDGKTIDTYDTTFGYRFFTFDVNRGFSLNGRPVKIKGVCMHHDQGALGSVATRDAIARQVAILKDMGANSIRTSHNTPSRQLVEICNEEGILLDLEFFDGWAAQKNENSKDYARFFGKTIGNSRLIGARSEDTWAKFDLEQTVGRDANSPAVIMWSLGNEMNEGTVSGVPNFNQVQNNLIAWTRAADPTRPVTTGDNRFKRNGSLEYNPAALAAAGGVNGFNYIDGGQYERAHRNADWKIIGSETASAINSRGVYHTHGQDNGVQQMTSYDYSCVSWGHVASQAWYDAITRDYVAGEYVWTGFDYLGEPTPWNGTTPGVRGRWPSPKNSYFGIIDTAGLPKDSFYLYQSQWNDSKHTLHILPAWNSNVVKRDGRGNVDVVVYSDAPTVKLFFTPAGSTERREIGSKTFTHKTTPDNHFTYQIYEGQGADRAQHRNLYLTWKVPYADGTITAEAYDEHGDKIDTSDWDGRQSVTTAGPAAKLVATVNRTGMSANGVDLAYVRVSVQDAAGNLVPNADNRIAFEVRGAGSLAGIDNGCSPDHQSFRDADRKAFSGELVGIIQAGTEAGTATVTVSSEGLAPATVTIPVAAVEGSSSTARRVDSLFYSRHIYVKTGSKLSLPEKLEVRYSDATVADETVAWDAYDEEALGHAGTFTVTGTVAGVRANISVTVLDDIVALMNYSATTPVGREPILPDARPAIQANGTVLHASFPVTWEDPAKGAYDQEGTVVLKGTATVFGRDLPLTATIRVQRETISIGSNLATVSTPSQDIPEGKQNDTLSAVVDGSTEVSANAGGGINPSGWTNFTWSQEGHTKAAITLRFATQQRIGQARVHFFVDTYSARLPKPGTTVLEVSENGQDWTPLTVKETVGKAAGRVTPYTYEFTPVSATFVRITVTNSDEVLSGPKPCTGISEIELFGVIGRFDTGDAAELSALTVNGKNVSEQALSAGHFDTPAIIANVDATGKDNAAVTVLPAHEQAVKIVLESEDHMVRGLYTINLGTEAVVTPDDSSRDYPVAKITATAGSEVEDRHASATEGKIALAFDGKEETHWHSTWAPTPASDHWVVMELAEPTAIDGLRYLARPGSASANGVVTEGVLEYSTDGVAWQAAAPTAAGEAVAPVRARRSAERTWVEAGRATWPSPSDSGYERAWRLIQLDQPVTAKYFRFQGLNTYADGGRTNQFVSASEIRLRMAKQTTDISTATLEAPNDLGVFVVDAEHPATFDPSKVSVSLGDKKLAYGIDYVLEYEGNTDAGEATLRARGIDEYAGQTSAHTFTVQIVKPEVEGISVATMPTKHVYQVAEKLDPAGLVLTLAMSDASSAQVVYDDTTKADVSFEPSLDTAFATAGSQDIRVSYKGHTATFTVTVLPKDNGGTDNGGTDTGGTGNSGTNNGGTGNGGTGGSTGNTGTGQGTGTGTNGGTGNTGQGAGQGGDQGSGQGKQRQNRKHHHLPRTGDIAGLAGLAGLAGAGAILVAVGGKKRSR
ncbi:discoidin domain-containing protein [Collinsella sp. AGMB00827]|uniref:Discoidin domain-containing protein n=1 Tax=Collinsella ureilytica TaxID=2869515 RepID=A0ABS7MJZ6_9ACTN|nr:sugar-binding domain-containing protein [Collinsella urealyticum]MBY4797697.1 discoidin domain-containing protein [Collinsella urealyticum]